MTDSRSEVLTELDVPCEDCAHPGGHCGGSWAARAEIAEKVGQLPAYKLPGATNPFIEYAAVLRLIEGGPDDR